MSGSAKKKKENVDDNTYDISSIKRVTRNSKFLEVSTFSRAIRNGREMYKKKCAARATFLFLVIRPIVVFLPFSLHGRFATTIFSATQRYNIVVLLF